MCLVLSGTRNFSVQPVSGTADDQLEMKTILAQLDRSREEALKFTAEQHKLMAEPQKYAAEQQKLTNEALKIERERSPLPLIVVATMLGAGAVFVKLTGG